MDNHDTNNEVTDAMVEAAMAADYTDIDWQYGTIEEVLQSCRPEVVRGWMRAAITLALKAKAHE